MCRFPCGPAAMALPAATSLIISASSIRPWLIRTWSRTRALTSGLVPGLARERIFRISLSSLAATGFAMSPTIVDKAAFDSADGNELGAVFFRIRSRHCEAPRERDRPQHSCSPAETITGSRWLGSGYADHVAGQREQRRWYRALIVTGPGVGVPLARLPIVVHDHEGHPVFSAASRCNVMITGPIFVRSFSSALCTRVSASMNTTAGWCRSISFFELADRRLVVEAHPGHGADSDIELP